MIYTHNKPTLKFSELSTTVARPLGAGSRWKGIPDKILAGTIRKAIKARGWEFRNEVYSTAVKDQMAGYMDIKIPGVIWTNGCTEGLGFLHSNTRRHAIKLVIGGTVTVCSNGLVSGDYTLRRAHEKGLDLRAAIDEGLDDYAANRHKLPEMITALREKEVAEPDYNEYALNLAREGAIPWSRLSALDECYHTGPHGTGTMWALYNAFTHAIKKATPVRQVESINQMRQTLNLAL